MKNKMQTLVRGIIYDNPDITKEMTSMVVDKLDCITDQMDLMKEFIEQNPSIDGFPAPTAEELFMFGSLLSVVYPEQGIKNMIIPANLVNEKLYNDLKKIDIGEDIISSYSKIRDEKYYNKNTEEENSEYQIIIEQVDDASGDIIRSFTFNNEDDATKFIADKYSKGIITKEQASNLLNEIKS